MKKVKRYRRKLEDNLPKWHMQVLSIPTTYMQTLIAARRICQKEHWRLNHAFFEGLSLWIAQYHTRQREDLQDQKVNAKVLPNPK